MAEIREWPDLSLTARRAVLERLRKEAASGDEGRGSD
jgi:predicted Fe-S protein YdhL (DUF1289 family)